MHAQGLVGTIDGYSDGLVITSLVIDVVFGIGGYFFSERYRRTRGVTPWRLPSALWAVLLFFTSLIGAVVYLVACFTTRPGTGTWTGAPTPPRDGWNPPPAGGWNQPAPQGWDPPVPGGWGVPVPGSPGPAPPGGWEAPPPPGTAFPGFGAPGAASDATLPASGIPVPPPPPPPPPPPRSWLPDPGGRHELRYWDGTKFTEHVADAGKISVDPL